MFKGVLCSDGEGASQLKAHMWSYDPTLNPWGTRRVQAISLTCNYLEKLNIIWMELWGKHREKRHLVKTL